MNRSELAEYETRAKACDRGIDRDRCNECRIQLVLIAAVKRMDEALMEIAKGAEPLSEFEPDDDPWALVGYTAEDAQRRGKEWMHAKLAETAEKARLE